MRMSRHLGLFPKKRQAAADTSITFGTPVWYYGSSGSTWNVPYIGQPSGYKDSWCHIPIKVSGRACKLNHIYFSGYKQSVANSAFVIKICATNSAWNSTAVSGGNASVAFTDYNGSGNTSNGAGLMKGTFSNCVLPVGTYWMWVYKSDSSYRCFGNGNYNFKYFSDSHANG